MPDFGSCAGFHPFWEKDILTGVLKGELLVKDPDLDEKTRVSMRIYGEEYVIKGLADARYIEGIAAYVDKKMRQIGQKNPQLPVSKVAVLAALNIADELCKLQDDYDNLVKLLEEQKAKK